MQGLTQKQEALIRIKRIYNEQGIEGLGNEFALLLKSNGANIKWASDFGSIAYKISTCTSNCFDNIENKNEVACYCNKTHVIVSI